MSNEKMREEFEAWAAPFGFDVDSIYADDAFKCYCFTATQNVFDIWKAGWEKSRAALCVNLPKQWYDDGLDSDLMEAHHVGKALDASGIRYK